MSEQNGETIWRASNPSGRGGVAVTRRPFTAHCHDAANGTRYRGGQCVALPPDATTLRFHAEASLVLQATVARAMKSDVRLGDPLIAELEATGYGVAALHGGAFAGAGPDGSQEQSVAAGEFFPSRVTEIFWNL